MVEIAYEAELDSGCCTACGVRACRGLAPVARAESQWHFYGERWRLLACRRPQSPLARLRRHGLFVDLRWPVLHELLEQRGEGPSVVGDVQAAVEA